MQTLLLNIPTVRKSLNSLYTFPMSTSVLTHIEYFISNHEAGETINNIYEIPSLACAVQYLHVATGFPTKATWIKSIHNGNYLTWPLLSIHNVNRHFPESKDIQKGHTHNQRQGVRLIKSKAPHPGTEPPQQRKNTMSSSMCMNPRVPCTRTKQGIPPTGRSG